MNNQNVWPQVLLSVLFLVGYFGTAYLLLFGGVEVSNVNREMGIMLLGVITTAIPVIMKYWFTRQPASNNTDN